MLTPKMEEKEKRTQQHKAASFHQQQQQLKDNENPITHKKKTHEPN